jgi:hypothetical protein
MPYMRNGFQSKWKQELQGERMMWLQMVVTFLVGFSVGAMTFSALGQSSRAVLQEERDWWRDRAYKTLELWEKCDRNRTNVQWTGKEQA